MFDFIFCSVSVDNVWIKHLEDNVWLEILRCVMFALSYCIPGQAWLSVYRVRRAYILAHNTVDFFMIDQVGWWRDRTCDPGSTVRLATN